MKIKLIIISIFLIGCSKKILNDQFQFQAINKDFLYQDVKNFEVISSFEAFVLLYENPKDRFLTKIAFRTKKNQDSLDYEIFCTIFYDQFDLDGYTVRQIKHYTNPMKIQNYFLNKYNFNFFPGYDLKLIKSEKSSNSFQSEIRIHFDDFKNIIKPNFKYKLSRKIDPKETPVVNWDYFMYYEFENPRNELLHRHKDFSIDYSKLHENNPSKYKTILKLICLTSYGAPPDAKLAGLKVSEIVTSDRLVNSLFDIEKINSKVSYLIPKQDLLIQLKKNQQIVDSFNNEINYLEVIKKLNY